MARALRRKETSGPWILLYETLRQAVADEVICCPSSSIIEEEGELSKHSSEILRLSRELANPGLRHHQWIRDVQLANALRGFLQQQPPQAVLRQDSRDAFYGKINQWLSSLNITFNSRTPEQWIEQRRDLKETTRVTLEEIYQRYAVEGLTFDDVQRKEATALGPTLMAVGKKELREKRGLAPVPPGTDMSKYWWPSDYEKLLMQVGSLTGLPSSEALPLLDSFLQSEHLARIPLLHISSRLHAALALLTRGKFGRPVGSGDRYDIDHLSTYVPYVDMFVTDKFFADLCNQSNMRIGDSFRCMITSLGTSRIESFVEQVKQLATNSPQADLKRRIRQGIREGGATEDFVRRATAYLRARGTSAEEQ